MSSSCTGLTQQGTQKFGGVRVGNGPTEDEAGIMDHDQLSQHSEEGDEVSLITATFCPLSDSALNWFLFRIYILVGL